MVPDEPPQHCGSRGIKARRDLGSQEQRRKAFLARQRLMRQKLVDDQRHMFADDITEEVVSDMEVLVETAVIEQAAVMNPIPSKKHKSIDSCLRFKDLLSVAEYFIEIPSDLRSRWLVTRRPHGTRCSVVASRGSTVSRRVDGTQLHRFPSVLPGGSPGTRRVGKEDKSKGLVTVLDCFYSHHDSTYYVLDMLNWKGYALSQCTAEFRFYWMATKFQEDCPSDISLVSEFNHFRFIPLNFSPSTAENMLELCLSQCPPFFDGLLFYHMDGHYVAGVTPLVLVHPLQQNAELVGGRVLSNPFYCVSTRTEGCADVSNAEHQAAILTYHAERSFDRSCQIHDENFIEDILRSKSDSISILANEAQVSGLYTVDDHLVSCDYRFCSDGDEALVEGDVVLCFHHGISSCSGSGNLLEGVVVVRRLDKIRNEVDSWTKIQYENSVKQGTSIALLDVIASSSFLVADREFFEESDMEI